METFLNIEEGLGYNIHSYWDTCKSWTWTWIEIASWDNRGKLSEGGTNETLSIDTDAKTPTERLLEFGEYTSYVGINLSDPYVLLLMLLTQIIVVTFIIIGLRRYIGNTKNNFHDKFLCKIVSIYCILTCIVCFSSYITFLNGSCAANTPIDFDPDGIPVRNHNYNLSSGLVLLFVTCMSANFLMLLIIPLFLMKGYSKCYYCCRCTKYYNKCCCHICCPEETLPKCKCNCLANKSDKYVWTLCGIIVLIGMIVVGNQTPSLVMYLNNQYHYLYLIIQGPFTSAFTGFIIALWFVSLFGSSLTSKQALLWMIVFSITAWLSILIDAVVIYPMISLCVFPIMIYLLFVDLKAFNIFSIHVLTLYTSTLDYLTDILVIVYWFADKESGSWKYAVIQIFILLFSQILSVISLNKLDKQIMKHNIGNQVYMLFIGLGRFDTYILSLILYDIKQECILL